MSELFKYMYGKCIDPLALSLEWYYEYLILAIIEAIAYSVAYKKVGNLYHEGWIEGRTIGSFFHWVIRAVVFIVLWGAINGVLHLCHYVHSMF